jgi:hypothetical protein
MQIGKPGELFTSDNRADIPAVRRLRDKISGIFHVTRASPAQTIRSMELAAAPLLDREEIRRSKEAKKIFSLVFGAVFTLIVSGYQFGRGNHTVYLLDGLRVVNPQLLRNDWFVTQTLQYHAFFSVVVATLMRLHVLESGFLIGYLAIVIIWHLQWRKLVFELGGDDRTYLISVFLFYISAGGISVGVFQFLQDGCFLPSNVASIAMLGGITSWVGGRRLAAGIWIGVAGLFHVNYAAVGIGLWLTLLGWQMLDQWPDPPFRKLLPKALRAPTPPPKTLADPRARWTLLLASAAALVPSLINVGMAIPDDLRHGGTMPMPDFVNVYVHFRHTHHFDPLRWPAILWISFLWPIPPAIWAASRLSTPKPYQPARREACRIFVIIAGLLIIAFLFAGVWFINEPLVQLCFWRFSIYIKLMSCVGAAFILCSQRLLRANTLSRILRMIAVLAVLMYAGFLLTDPKPRGAVWEVAYEHRGAVGMGFAMFIILAIEQSLPRAGPFRLAAIFALPLMVLIAWPHIGVGMTPEPDDADYRTVCVWARDPANTPVDAIFLTPPQETDFRLYAQRAIVVNFKHVPQLSGEIIQWEKRLLDVLGVTDVSDFPRDYAQTLASLGEHYESRSFDELRAVAAKYGARYIIVDHSFGPAEDGAIAFHRENNRYFVYDLQRLTSTQP